jgi:type III polyketide synthase
LTPSQYQKAPKNDRYTGIETRASVLSFVSGFATEKLAPTITEIDQFYLEAGVGLAVHACQKALGEWGGDYRDITHTVAVTCTNSSNPGFDLFVAKKLGLRNDLSRTLLHGVGCAGGLSIMRTAAEIACGATLRGKPARILGFACELCSLSIRAELDAVASAQQLADVSIAAALFGDGAASFVLCNDLGKETAKSPLFQVMEWGNASIPNTAQHIGFHVNPSGECRSLSSFFGF